MPMGRVVGRAALGAIALVAWPVAAAWLVLSARLGRAQEHRAALAEVGAAKGS